MTWQFENSALFMILNYERYDNGVNARIKIAF